MTPERHQRIVDLFHQARALPATERTAFLLASCEDDDLRLKVEHLLAHDQAPVPELNTGAGLRGMAFQALEDETPSDHDQTSQRATATRGESDASGPAIRKVGSYSIKRVIASGGMGTVYEAVQENPRRIVAVKLMRAGIASPSALRRFEFESQVLARLRHPNIAQVFEAGTHRDGELTVPFFAMEYIPNAQTITEYASLKKLGTRDRLALFAQVCDAVHHGHQKGIIHRDLKPSNILIESSGQVKIIDFGVARSTDSDMAVTTLQTDVGQLIGTLQYMSPEQCAADPHDIDTRSDVYALGVVLFELLTDQLPYDIRSRVLHEATRVIREEPPTKPSTINKTLRGEVETIALKALEKERDRRYPSALEFQQDILRYLRGEAISARRPTALYQARVFVRRHKGFLAAVAVVVLSLTAGLVGTALMYVRASHERDQAVEARGMAQRRKEEAELQTTVAQKINDFLRGLLASANPEKSGGGGRHDITVKEALDNAAAKIEGAFTESPAVEASIRETMGRTYVSLGLDEPALPHLKEALARWEQVRDPDHEDTLGIMNFMAAAYHRSGQMDHAEKLTKRVLDISRRTLGNDHEEISNNLNNLGLMYLDQGRFPEAEATLKEAVELDRRVRGDQHPDTVLSLNSLASCYWEQARYAEAEPLYVEVLRWRREHLGNEHPHTFNSINNLATLYHATKRYELAEPLYMEALAGKRRVIGETHPNTLSGLNHLGRLYTDMSRFEEALPFFEECQRGAEATLPEGHWARGAWQVVYGRCLGKLKRYEEAEITLLKAHGILTAALKPDHPHVLKSIDRIIELYEAWDRPDEANAWREKRGPVAPPDS